MRKSIALLCVIAMLISMAAVALASGSVGTPDVKTPTAAPTEAVTAAPTAATTAEVTAAPTAAATEAVTAAPTAAATEAVTAAPTAAVTAAPTEAVTAAPTAAPTATVTAAPTEEPEDEEPEDEEDDEEEDEEEEPAKESTSTSSSSESTAEEAAVEETAEAAPIVLGVQLSKIKDAVVADVVAKVNSSDEKMTVADVIDALADKLSEENKAKAEEVKALGYDFVTEFKEITTTDEDADPSKPVTATLIFDTLIGKENKDLSNYLIMLIDPETGEIVFIELDSESYDPVSGEITVDFPFQGLFALIEKPE